MVEQDTTHLQHCETNLPSIDLAPDECRSTTFNQEESVGNASQCLARRLRVILEGRRESEQGGEIRARGEESRSSRVLS